MVEHPEIIIDIDDDGTIDIKVNCVEGSKCTELTEELVKKLGKTKKVVLTDEYYQPSFEPVHRRKKQTVR